MSSSNFTSSNPESAVERTVDKAADAAERVGDRAASALGRAGDSVERNTRSLQKGVSRGSSELGNFLDDLSNLIRSNTGTDVKAEIERRIDQARDGMRDAAAQARGVAHSISESGHEAADRARHQVERGLDRSRETVSDYPLSAVAVAATGGLIVGLLLAARR